MPDIEVLLKKVKRIHFIGIGGSGMCPLAEILNKQGYILSGSDNNESDILDRIRKLGINVMMGQKAENIEGSEMIVYSAAIMEDNPELIAAKNSDIPTFKRSELLGAITHMYDNCMCVCGTHGKTTVTSMLTQILVASKKDPSAVIGGKLPLTNSYGLAGNSEHMVCEACEFKDTFLDLYPDTAVILNVDEDHLDYFGSLENIIKSFNKFSLKATKAIIYNGDDENTLKAIENIEGKEMISFGFKDTNDYYADSVTAEGSAFYGFDVCEKGNKIGHVKLSIPGKHNVINALSAIVTAIHSGVTIDECIFGIEAFRGAGRRFEILGKYAGITIADDYAHHPTELEVTLDSAVKMGYKKVWAVFQPFTYSRTKNHFDDFVKVLTIPDRCVLSEIMGSREINTYGIYSSQLAEKIPDSVWFNTFEEIADYVAANAESGDLVITLGCGDIYKAAKMIINILKTKLD
ncbi:MAG: UDP-N-acetylmuramate--L-alanine ligase [Clostridia bacterium]|nr:UDP-N-acetylmuramate--L-alanine ligase [Clostridia bacterium]